MEKPTTLEELLKDCPINWGRWAPLKINKATGAPINLVVIK
ncbi:MAG: hypothetical protein QXV69_06325 [Sulfolobaceae archaeon]